jgi:hypothetical protein
LGKGKCHLRLIAPDNSNLGHVDIMPSLHHCYLDDHYQESRENPCTGKTLPQP